MNKAIQTAVEAAKDAYESADKSPVDHAFVMLKGIDGRTSLAHALKACDDIDVSNDDYHGTTATIEGITRYGMAQKQAYHAFIRTLEDNGIDTDMQVWNHAH